MLAAQYCQRTRLGNPLPLGLFRRLEVLSLDLERLKPLGRLGENAAHISHEIKNYVSTLRSNNILLQNKLMAGESMPEMDRITRSAQRLEGFARSILDYSNSADSMPMKSVRIEEVIRETIRIHFPDRQDQVSIETEGTPWIQGDAASLEQVFVNLFKNSFEAGANSVKIRIREEASRLSVLFEDDGRGCSLEDLPRLTSPFFTTKKDRGGTGLGLSIASAIMQNHGGTIEPLSRNHSESKAPGMAFILLFPPGKDAKP